MRCCYAGKPNAHARPGGSPSDSGPLVNTSSTTLPTAHRAFHVLAKPTGAVCNLDCTYCFFLSKEELYPGSRFRMADDVLETYIRQSSSRSRARGHRRAGRAASRR